MFPLLVGFGSALLFGIFAYGTYGLDGAMDFAWTGMVFWALISSGLLVFVVNLKMPCLLCRLSERTRCLRKLCREPATCR